MLQIALAASDQSRRKEYILISEILFPPQIPVRSRMDSLEALNKFLHLRARFHFRGRSQTVYKL